MSAPATWRLDARDATLVLAAFDDGLPECVWWGARLPDDEDLAALALARRRAVGGAMLDDPAPMSLCPEDSRGFMGHPGLIGAGADGRRWAARFTLRDATLAPGSLAFEAEDKAAGLALTLRLRMDPASGMIAARSRLRNIGDAPYDLAWLAAPALPAPECSAEIIGFDGRWRREFQQTSAPWRLGAWLRESRTGRSGPEHFPGLAAPGPGCANCAGEAWAWHLSWSGGHRMLAEEIPDGRRQIQFGALLRPGEVRLAPGAAHETPELLAVYSGAGLNGIAHAFHDHARAAVRFPVPARPLHFNCWEAVYFDHDPAVLGDLARRAAALGAERFVLDDGWFRGRRDDRAGLGDWQADRAKFPDGLDPLIGEVNALGMGFGLWVEPEMANPDSDLLRAHPDWILQTPPHAPVTGRHQQVLDLGRAEVAAHLFAALDGLLSAHRVEYLKWDHNRGLVMASGADGRAAYAAQTRAFYALVDRLRAAHPGVEIESCASGGGRVDYGVLGRMHRVWLSDSNDALERLRMQHVAALFLPPEITGSHVGPRVCHTSGRVAEMEFRALVAAQRHMGFELDPRELTDAEAETLARAARWWKANRGWLHGGRLHRLDAARGMIAEVTVAADGGRFAAFVGIAEAPDRAAPAPLRLAGLDPARRYRLRLANPGAIPGNVCRRFDSPLCAPEGLNLSGAALMRAGIQTPIGFAQTMWLIEGERLADET